MQPVQRWPIDYDALEKGHIIPASRLEEITGLTQTSPKYSLAIVGVKERIERDMAERGRPVLLAAMRGNLKVLTDSEAAVYVDVMARQYERGMIRQHIRGEVSINVAALTDDQRKAHDRASEIRGRKIQALAQVRKQVRIEAHRRTVPGLPHNGSGESNDAPEPQRDSPPPAQTQTDHGGGGYAGRMDRN